MGTCIEWERTNLGDSYLTLKPRPVATCPRDVYNQKFRSGEFEDILLRLGHIHQSHSESTSRDASAWKPFIYLEIPCLGPCTVYVHCSVTHIRAHRPACPPSALTSLSPVMSKEQEQTKVDESTSDHATDESGPNAIDEKKLLRKLDWHLVPGLTLLFLLSFLDRSNGNPLLSLSLLLALISSFFSWKCSYRRSGHRPTHE